MIKKSVKYSSHHLGTLYTKNKELLTNSVRCQTAINEIIKKYNVINLGYLKHDFDGGGFTIVIALAESHISLHTWPEYSSVQLDVFLCNYINDNRVKTKRIFNDICKYFEPEEVITEIVDRK